MVDSNIIGLVIFSGFLGLAIWWINYESKEEAKPLYDLINAAHKAMINMALLILDYMPWAVMALLANTIAQRGLSSILEVGKFIIALYVAAVVQFIIQILFLVINGLLKLKKKTQSNHRSPHVPGRGMCGDFSASIYLQETAVARFLIA